ncbi:Monooxygenase FAD-binding protein [uncultured Stenotrophomonas sp.]|uniref:Monooxygenase FAD-binding protein n=1 Tax=uncultured Stenotrophomonas sp. TaxID=165438 RepID=A0A1Y5PZV7_9GAMM|nr:Monooxygenase FAD-binding protein [uncultured Stenotrophomonas sp.]
MHHTPVLVVGGSLVGLSTSLFLSMYGIAHVLVEKHPGSSPHPRAMGFTERTLELYRAAGIGERIPQVPAGSQLRRVKAQSLAGHWSEPLPWTPGKPGPPASAYSPCRGAAIAQDRLEPILREATAERGADLRYGQRLLGWREVEDGIIATISDRAGGTRNELHVTYLLACDGAASPIREQAGIARIGVGHLHTLRSVLFHCPGADAWLDRGVRQFQIDNPRVQGFLTTYGDGRWVLMFDDDRPRGGAELDDAIRAALGRDIPFERITTGRWEMAGRIAAAYSSGRVFLLGDAAHQLPPTRGGFGANTGIDDAGNLAWKLQLVLRGISSPSLLDSYGSERQPIGWLRHQQTFARPDHARWLESPLETTLHGEAAMELGQLQRSHIVLGAGAELPAAASPESWAGQPGTRAPHVWVTRHDVRISTIDLFACRFTLLSQAPEWIAAGRNVAGHLGLPLDTVQVGMDIRFDHPEEFADAFGVTARGVSLVRPDGVVAWRHPDEARDRETCLADAFRRAACLRG